MAVDPCTLDSGVYTKEYFLQEDVCRLCWSKYASKDDVSNLSAEIIDKIRDSINLNISVEGSNYPYIICSQCLVQIEKIYEFRNFCTELDKKLQEIFINDSSSFTITFEHEIVKSEAFEAMCDDRSSFSAVNIKREMQDSNQSNSFDDTSTTDNTVFIKTQASVNQNSENSTIDIRNPKNKCLHCKKRFYNRYVCTKHEQSFCKLKKKEIRLKLCGKKFTSKEAYEAHKAMHSNEMALRNLDATSHVLLECNICQNSFKTKKMLKNHYLKTHGINTDPVKCFSCKEMFKTQKQLLNHVIKTGCLKNKYDSNKELNTTNEQSSSNTIMKDVEYLSDESIDFVIDDFADNLEPTEDFLDESNDDPTYIDPENDTSNILEPTVMIDHVQKSNYCTICFETFQSMELLISHRLELHGIGMEGSLQCLGCNKVCKNMHSRSSHEKGCNLLKDGYKCDLCERYLPSRRAYECHMRDHRLNKEINLPEELFKCKKCTEKFKTKECLKKHVLEDHQKNTSYVCETCGRSFTRIVYLTLHKRIHTGDKQYSCPTCPYRTTQRSALNVHMRVHTGERPYVCHLCPQRCVNKSNLRAHLMHRHLKVLKYQCQICSKKFAYKETLEAHVSITHEKVLPFNCQQCGATFCRVGGLQRHMRKKHGATTKRNKIAKTNSGKEKNTDNDIPNSNVEGEDFVSDSAGIEQGGAFQIEALE